MDSSFLLHAERVSERYGVAARAILQRVGEAGYVGGRPRRGGPPAGRRGYVAAFEQSGCDELIMIPSSAELDQVTLLAEAVKR